MTSFHQEHQRVHMQVNIGSVTLHLHTTAHAAGMLEKAVRLLQTEHYDEALQLLDKVLLADEEIADAYYYRGLALLKGKRPKSCLKPNADKITRDLSAAINLDPRQAHYYYLLALVWHDYFLLNGFYANQHEIRSLLVEADNYPIDIPKCKELLRHTNSPSSPIVDILKQRF